jgi:hypothetical protein
LKLLRYFLILSLFNTSCSSEVDFSEDDKKMHVVSFSDTENEFEVAITDVDDEYIVVSDGSIIGKVEAAIGANTFPRANNLYISAAEDLSGGFVYPEEHFDSDILSTAQSVEIEPLHNDTLLKNIVVSIPLPEPMAITSSYLVVLYKYSLDGKEYYGAFACEDYEKSANLVSVSVDFLGTFQAVYIDKRIQSLHALEDDG